MADIGLLWCADEQSAHCASVVVVVVVVVDIGLLRRADEQSARCASAQWRARPWRHADAQQGQERGLHRQRQNLTGGQTSCYRIVKCGTGRGTV